MKTLAREILLSFWKIHILHHAAEGPVYGQWISGELRRHGYDISPGTLYPLLKRLERHGWLKCQRNSSNGKHARQPYTLTEEGLQVLHLIREQLKELYQEVITEERSDDI
jgi:PadR family transcriptional regulator